MERGGKRRKGEWDRRKAEKHGKKAAFRAEGTSPYGRREHITMNGESAMLREKEREFFRTQNALGTTNALFYFLGRGGSWAAVKLVLQVCVQQTWDGHKTDYRFYNALICPSTAFKFCQKSNLLVALLM